MCSNLRANCFRKTCLEAISFSTFQAVPQSIAPVAYQKRKPIRVLITTNVFLYSLISLLTDRFRQNKLANPNESKRISAINPLKRQLLEVPFEEKENFNSDFESIFPKRLEIMQSISLADAGKEKASICMFPASFSRRVITE
jgi:hypothetical protein